jgi:hypothetical protein
MLSFLRIVLPAILLASGATAAQVAYESVTTHLTMTITGPASVKSGEETKIVLALDNDTAVPIQIVRNGTEAELSDNAFTVQGPYGPAPETKYSLALKGKADPVSNSEARGFLDRTQVTLKPGDEIKLRSIVSNLYDMTAPGQYVIWAQRYLTDGTRIKSNQITISVTE